ncbi:MAG: hypothetical protein Terrestrivirus9_10 [Terrestrivirus sp.]|uniref:Uncharacterized protein n=1 Tax=Terrestrivirus sp. TaxID=2487775 RepID=A0A3G4ZSJ6_9VIRU|nr:MAG: hypothetical protein Terrestrivirus9_10 [Terrestrivirus sp.]
MGQDCNSCGDDHKDHKDKHCEKCFNNCELLKFIVGFAMDTNQGDLSALPRDVKELLCQVLKGSFVADIADNNTSFVNVIGYITRRVNDLCLSPCVKAEINKNILSIALSRFNNLLSPVISIGGPVFVDTNVCSQPDLDKCGYIVVSAGSALGFLLEIRLIIQSLFADKCNCGDDCERDCDCDLTFCEVCKFVFGKFCIVNDLLVNSDSLVQQIDIIQQLVILAEKCDKKCDN